MTAPDTEPVSLRGHHLICLQFLHGKGYSVEFVRNILRLRDQFEQGGAIVTSGHDDVCIACPRNNGSPCKLCPDTETQVQHLDDLAFHLLGVHPGDRVSASELHERVADALPEWQREACADCAWTEVCASAINLLSRT